MYFLEIFTGYHCQSVKCSSNRRWYIQVQWLIAKPCTYQRACWWLSLSECHWRKCNKQEAGLEQENFGKNRVECICLYKVFKPKEHHEECVTTYSSDSKTMYIIVIIYNSTQHVMQTSLAIHACCSYIPRVYYGEATYYICKYGFGNYGSSSGHKLSGFTKFHGA